MIYVSAAGSMLCQIINALLLLPVSVARPLLSQLLELLPPLDCLNRLLPAASPLEDQELQWPLQGELRARLTWSKFEKKSYKISWDEVNACTDT